MSDQFLSHLWETKRRKELEERVSELEAENDTLAAEVDHWVGKHARLLAENEDLRGELEQLRVNAAADLLDCFRESDS